MRAPLVRQITLGTAILLSAAAYAQTPAAKGRPPPPSPKEAAADDPRKTAHVEGTRFKLYSTENNWTLLLLDTRDGRIWQLQYTINDNAFRGSVPLSLFRFADGPNDRFELVPTKNMWNFMLLDQIDGRTWQCQFTLDKPDARGCIPLDPMPKLE